MQRPLSANAPFPAVQAPYAFASGRPPMQHVPPPQHQSYPAQPGYHGPVYPAHPAYGYPQQQQLPYFYPPRVRQMPVEVAAEMEAEVEKRSNERYVREMIFEGTFIFFMLLTALATTYFLVYYLGWGPVMEENGIDFLHQWAEQFPGWMDRAAHWLKSLAA